VEIRCLDQFRALVADGCGLILAPNHCRYSDPPVLGAISKETGVYVYFCASWHLFTQSRVKNWIMTRLGGMSIYREGADRECIRECARILERNERPIVLFPEGTFYRTNDRLGPMQDGVSFIARRAQKKGTRPIAILPIGVKYWFTQDPTEEIERRLCAFEQKCHLHPKRGQDFVERLKWVGTALLTVKEIEILGAPQTGGLDGRQQRLADHLLRRYEGKYIRRPKGGAIMDRIRVLRSLMVKRFVESEPRGTEWYELLYEIEDLAFAQQLVSHSWEYLEAWPCLERIGETLQRFEEDLYDQEVPFTTTGAVIQIGEPLAVADFDGAKAQDAEGGEAPKTADADPLTSELARRIQGILDQLVQEGPPAAWNAPTGPGPPPAPREVVPSAALSRGAAS
jgi:hypothetical protein